MERLRVEVVHVVGPDELDEYDLEAALRERAEGRYVIVGRKGGSPSLVEKLLAFVRRDGIEAVTLVADAGATEGEELVVGVEETARAGVYEVLAVEEG
jgi:hypothetical protein